MFAVFKRELKTYFLTPTGYIFMGIFLLLAGIFFTYGNLFMLESRFANYLSNIVFIFLLVVPVLTMRLLTDERRQKTDQLLLTSPLRITDIVLGKYFAAFVLFLITIAVTVLYAVVIAIYGDLDTTETIGAYIGFILMGASFISLGLFISGTTDNQVIAAIVTFCALLLSWLIDGIVAGLPTSLSSGVVFAAVLVVLVAYWVYRSTKNLIIAIGTAIIGAGVVVLFYFLKQGVFIGFIGNFLSWFSLTKRYVSFSMGIIKLSDVVYYLSFVFFFIYLTVRLIEKKRWE
ncbi:MAG TPA: ABC transporter permease [Spirochaetia bacterium]|mgnify:CR=1 FL=1|nr:ABC transporter permease [Spirochaetia bacterium]